MKDAEVREWDTMASRATVRNSHGVRERNLLKGGRAL
jgi:hypothetical protein